MQEATSSPKLSSKRDQCFYDQYLLFVAHEMQNTTSIMSWKDNVTSETVYNPTFSSMGPTSSCSSKSQFYLDDNLQYTQGDEDILLTENNMGQRDTKYHLLPQYKCQTSYSPSSSSTITATAPKSLHNSTKSILSDGEEEVKDYELMEKPRSKNNNTISSKREKTLENNRQAASRCRQRKKEWLNQLQTNVKSLARENKMLEEQSMSLREEILNLKTILLSHRDCSQPNNPDTRYL